MILLDRNGPDHGPGRARGREAHQRGQPWRGSVPKSIECAALALERVRVRSNPQSPDFEFVIARTPWLWGAAEQERIRFAVPPDDLEQVCVLAVGVIVNILRAEKRIERLLRLLRAFRSRLEEHPNPRSHRTRVDPVAPTLAPNPRTPPITGTFLESSLQRFALALRWKTPRETRLGALRRLDRCPQVVGVGPEHELRLR